jgi:hypothetical protein
LQPQVSSSPLPRRLCRRFAGALLTRQLDKTIS